MNRLDNIVVFKPLGKEELRRIIDIELETVQQRILSAAVGKPFSLHITESGREFLLTEGTDIRYGARPLKRAIERRLVQPMSKPGEVRESIGRLKERYPRVARYYRMEYDEEKKTFAYSLEESKRTVSRAPIPSILPSFEAPSPVDPRGETPSPQRRVLCRCEWGLPSSHYPEPPACDPCHPDRRRSAHG